jgi:NAD(P)-dependent dehydrogenase (short-subunit alcohol dehydrogenase family)
MSDLDGRVAIVTGGGTGIGEACAVALSVAGAAVLVADIDELSAQAVVLQIRENGGRAEAHCADVTIVQQVEEMVERCMAAFGGLHVAVNNAGIHGDPGMSPAGEYPLEWWDRTIATNLSSVFYCLRAEISAMRRTGAGGSIINMASIYGQVAAPGVAGYVAAKHGVVGLTKAAALDHANDGIRVNAVGPGFIKTGLVERNVPAAELGNVAALHALNRIGEPREVADLVVFLAGGGASFLTGAFYAAEGGYLAR